MTEYWAVRYSRDIWVTHIEPTLGCGEVWPCEKDIVRAAKE